MLTLNEALRKYAGEDLALADAEGEIAIANTKLGVVTLVRLDATGEYRLTDGGAYTTFTGTKEEMISYLMSNVYQVVEEV